MDPSTTLDLGMPPGSYIGYDGMSDVEAATFLNGTLAFYHLSILYALKLMELSFGDLAL